MIHSLILALVLPLLVFVNACGGTGQQQSEINGTKVPIVKLGTDHGDIYLYLYEDTPEHRKNFLNLVNEGFYDGTTFHRVIDGFMIQGGDPNTKPGNSGAAGQGGPGYTLPAEIKSKYKHKEGALAAARKGDQVNPKRRSSGSQFYIVENENGTPFLDGKYTVFGETIKGLEVVHKIADQSTNGADKPKQRIEMKAEVLYYEPEKLMKKFNFAVPQAEAIEN